jgi:cell division transport system permease protein
MKIRTISYYIRESFKNLIRNRLMTFASVFTVASCIFIVALFYCLAANLSDMLNNLEGTVGLEVYVRDDVSPEEVLLLDEKIAAIPHVVSAEYVSSDEALARFTAGLTDARITAGLENDNPLPRSFSIAIDDLRYQEDVINALMELESFGVDTIDHMRETANVILTVSNVVRGVLMVLIIVLATVSIVIITNTIRITVNARRNEITIMKYVGATDWFIRWPFIIEGVLIGFLGGLIPSIICALGYSSVVNMIKSALPLLHAIRFLPPYAIFAYLVPFSIMLGVFIGVIGSGLTIRKHLRV